MAVNVASLVATLDADTRGFQRKFDGADRRIDAFDRNGRRATEGLNSGLRQGERNFDGLGRTIRRAGGMLVAAFGARKIAQTIGSSVTAAADLDESFNAIQQVVGEGADSFLQFGRDSSSALGLTQQALNEAVVPMAALLDNAGIKGDELSETLQGLSTRATDVASVFNADVNEVLAAFGSSLRGEQEPARQFGVNISAAAVQAEALASGLAESKDAIDENAKAQATLNLIMEATESSAGDFAKTADSLPNLMRRINATATDTRAAFGRGLLDPSVDAASALLDGLEDLQPTLEDAGRQIGDAFGPALEKSVTLALDLAEDAMPAMVSSFELLGSAVEDVVDIMDSFKPVVDAVSAASETLSSATSGFEDLTGGLGVLEVGLRGVGIFAGTAADSTARAATEAEELATRAQITASVLDDVEEQERSVIEGAEELSESWLESQEAARDLTDQADELVDKLNDVVGVALDAESADIRFRDSLADLNEELGEGKRTLDLNTDAGRRNREAFIDAAQAALGHVEALREQGASTRTLREVMQGHIADLRRTGQQAGFSEDKIAALIARYGLVPSTLRTDVEIETANAIAAIERITGALASLTQGHGIVAHVTGGPGGITEFAHGGRPPMNRPSLIGEQGPELFQPDTAGTIIPNNALGGGGGLIIENHIAGSVVTERDLTETIQANIRDFQRRNGRTGFDI